MAHKTFISYKYSEARALRDRIIDALGADATYYKGETSDSPDLTDTSTENIKKNLRDMMFDTSVTIVIISPHMRESQWIPWEIAYCLKRTKRKNRTSQTNGIVGVIMKCNGSYNWFRQSVINNDGCSATSYRAQFVPNIIKNNRFNQTPPIYVCAQCRTVNELTGSYISYVDEDSFLQNPAIYIDNAYEKSENNASGYALVLEC